ncbi:GyrI-like domain-containing protein [Pseudoxanthomonas dokdonensis]|uniref:AraC effector-binding domain-containing protein n=1 Tax=Pseudoxanthomonas dokdonensis TaxID=344882 RepID=A0A0R0CKD5_9GAMM|nr:GyrI-like domain-containing protein [Pseudoxanthomonas dokdonensis]KRG70000.1 hypothetical protein ABB29_07085 [Pseudoxanthomonas dokdonensis]
MLENPEVVEVQRQLTAVIRINVPRARMAEVFAPAVSELLQVLAEQKIAPTGPLFAHHLRLHPDVFDFELGLPVENLVTSSGRVSASELPGGTIARGWHRGPYDGLPSAWAEFETWMQANGHRAADSLWEVYDAGPESGLEPRDWMTQLNRPLASR